MLEGSLAIFLLGQNTIRAYRVWYFLRCLFYCQIHYPDVFAQGPRGLSTSLGVANTIILLSSSYFMAKVMVHIHLDERYQCQRYL